MAKRRKVRKELKWIPVLLVAAAVVIGALVFWPENATAQGITYLQQQEQKDVQEISAALSEKKTSEMRQAIDDGKVDVFALFGDAAIFGDSRVVGFSLYGYFSDSHVFAGAGHTVNNIPDYISQVEALNPSIIFFSYGMNDMGLALDDTDEGGYGALYQSQIEKVTAVCPNAQIVVNSIIPATPEAVAESPRWNQVDNYNQKIKAMCEENGWTYVDNSEICGNGNADIYQADGIHYLTSFYPVWAENMIMTIWD